LYVPPHFREDRVPILHAAIRRIRLATLVTTGPDGPVASHVPMILDPEPKPFGTLRGHLARANPQGGAAAPSNMMALAVFLGPEAYVTPAWYATKAQTGKVVPTWNYVAVHAAGTLHWFDDPDRLLALVTELTETQEEGRSVPWAVSDAPADYLHAMLRGIVGFELAITRLDGKCKLSQNRPADDRAGVAAGLADEGETEVAALVAAAGTK
jgi:transcriptional regulator